LEFLTKQLISDEISKSMGSEDRASPAGIVLQDILSLSTVLARVAGVAENYCELIKGHDLISFTLEMVQNLMKLVREREGRRERGREGRRQREKVLISVFIFYRSYHLCLMSPLTLYFSALPAVSPSSTV
jgi:hypothetical protein